MKRLWCKNKNEWEKNNWKQLPDGNFLDLDNHVIMRKETHELREYEPEEKT